MYEVQLTWERWESFLNTGRVATFLYVGLLTHQDVEAYRPRVRFL